MEKSKTQVINGVEYVYQDKPVWDANKKYGTIVSHMFCKVGIDINHSLGKMFISTDSKNSL